MRIWISARIARIGIALTATAIVFTSVAASGLTGVNARADALPAAFEKTDTVMTAVESSLAHGEALALRAPAPHAPATCSAGFSAGEVERSGNRSVQQLRYYYDSACTTLARLQTVQTSGGDALVISTTFSRSGVVLVKRVTDFGAQAATQTAASRLTAGDGSSVVALANVSWTKHADGSEDASVARVEDPQHQSIGVVENVNLKAPLGGAGSGAGNGVAYRSADGGLAVTLDAPYRVMAAPSSKIDDNAVSWSAQVGPDGLPSRLDITGAARADGLTTSVRTAGGRFAGRIAVAGGAVSAEFNVDRLGNGLVRFAGGETGTIADWHLLASAS